MFNFSLICFPFQEATEQGAAAGGRRELKSLPFISYLSALQQSQLLSDDIVNGPDMMGKVNGEQYSPIPVLLDVSRVVPLYSLVQDNITKEAFKSATMSSYWCAGKGDVIDNWCRCDLSAFSREGLPNCSPLRQPILHLATYLEPSSTMVALEWTDIEPVIGYKVSDYIIQHKRVEDPSEPDVYTGGIRTPDLPIMRRPALPSAPLSPHYNYEL
uniref:Astrotactin 2 n=1 Tax=Neogobius melanostomus TaxID=47308 RepID=A0A8C6T239_9GOBI